MWIIPNTHPLYLVFAADMTESAEDLHLLESSIEFSLMWRSKHSQFKTWSQRWRRESWMQHLFGRTLKHSRHTCFEEKLQSSLVAIPASHFQMRAKDSAPKTPGICGRTSENTLTQFDLFGVFLKTSKDTLPSDSERLSATWKNSVTRRRGEYSARLKSAHLTSENESTSWVTGSPIPHPNQVPTPDTRNSQNGSMLRNLTTNAAKKGSSRGVSLHHYVYLWPTPTAQDNIQVGGNPDHPKRGTTLGGAARNWPTPTVDSASSRTKKYKQGGTPLAMAVKTFPTPTSRDHKGGYKTAALIRSDGKSRAFDLLPNAAIGGLGVDAKPGQLNPDWVEALMGLPPGWTALDGESNEWENSFSSTDWEAGIPRVVDSCAHRVDRIRLLGNGVVPATAAKAWLVLSNEINADAGPNG